MNENSSSDKSVSPSFTKDDIPITIWGKPEEKIEGKSSYGWGLSYEEHCEKVVEWIGDGAYINTNDKGEVSVWRKRK